MGRFLLSVVIIFCVLCTAGSLSAQEECPYGDQRCKIDRNLDQLEEGVQDFRQRYREGDMWTLPDEVKEEKPTKTKYGTRALKYPLLLPTYLTRAFTWPIAIIADSLIKTGAVRKIVDVVSNDERTFWVYPRLELGFGSGFGGGVGVTHYDLFGEGYKLSAYYLIYLNLDQKVKLNISNRELFYIGNKPFAFKLVNEFERRNESKYFGKGIHTSKDVFGRYGWDELKTGGWFGFEPLKNLLLATHLFFIWSDSRTASTGPFVQDVFPSSELVAFGENLYYLKFGFDIVHDNRDSESAPEKGGKRRFSFSHFENLGSNSYDYNQYEVELLQYFRIWKPRHVIALRTMWTFQQRPSEEIPFYRMTRLDVYSPNRSFEWGRFRNHSRGVINVEYRYPVWEYMDGQLFFDAGRVFDSVTDVSFKDFKYSGGIGLRFIAGEYFLSRLQFAYGNDGPRVLFKTSQAF